MGSLAAIFVHTDPIAVAQQLIDRLVHRKAEPEWHPTQADDFALADFAGVQVILEQATAAASNDNERFDSYIAQANKHLQDALNLGFPPMIPLTPSVELHEELAQLAPELSLLPIEAETYLAATAWISSDRAKSQEYLTSAYRKACAVASARPSRLVDVREVETVRINGSLKRQKVWRFTGQRPIEGSATRLAQDIKFALFVSDGKNPTPLEVYENWKQAPGVASSA